jgi:hypothetical protein
MPIGNDMQFTILSVVAFGCGIVYASFFEWTLHKFVMHRVIFGFKYAFDAHAKVHHGMYGADQTYHTHSESNVKKIPMAWWNGPLLIVVSSALPTLLISWPFGLWWITVGIIIAVAVYYGAYEYFHWCMHYPKKRWFEKTRWFKWIDDHHRLHHKHMGKNLNVVLPIADWCLGTLITRSTVR